jgi:hypothetical protein
MNELIDSPMTTEQQRLSLELIAAKIKKGKPSPPQPREGQADLSLAPELASRPEIADMLDGRVLPLGPEWDGIRLYWCRYCDSDGILCVCPDSGHHYPEWELDRLLYRFGSWGFASLVDERVASIPQLQGVVCPL